MAENPAGKRGHTGSWGCLLIFIAWPLFAQDQNSHARHRMSIDETGMVMNHNADILPQDCREISRDYEFEVIAGTEFAEQYPGSVFGFNQNEFEVEPCSRIRIVFSNRDEIRHQWMLHGLPRYLYPGGMFHLEAAGGQTRSGSFIIPSDHKTYLVHCDIAQHMEKGMKAQLKTGRGSGDLWSIPGLSGDFNRADYLPAYALILWWLLHGSPFRPAPPQSRRQRSRHGTYQCPRRL